MIRAAEILGFVAVSAALHALAFSQFGGPQGAGEGAGGSDRVTLAAADAGHAALVERWRESRDEPPLPTLQAPAAETAPTRPAPEAAAPVVPAPDAPAIPSTEASPDDPGRPAPFQPLLSDAPSLPDLPHRLTAEDFPRAATETRPTAPPPPALAAPVAETAPEAATRSEVFAASVSPRPQSRPDSVAAPVAPPVAAPPPPASAPATAQAASGGASGSTRGETGRDATPSAGNADPALMAQWGAQIAARIQARVPRVATTGAVTLRITVGRDGRLQSVGIVQSSGNAALDQAGIQVVRSAGRFPAAPGNLAGESFVFNVPIRFV